MEIKKKFIYIGAAVGAVLLLLISWNYIRTSPQYSLYQMYRAIEARDYEKVTKYVDVDSVVDNTVNQILEETKEETQADESDPWAAFGQSLAEGFIMAFKPQLKEEAKNTIRNQIESGEFKKDYKPGNLAKAYTKINVEREGKVARVTINSEEKEPLKLKMRQKENYWQVFELEFEIPDAEVREENAQRVKYGDRASIDEGWYLTVNSPEEYSPTNYLEAPSEGQKLISVELVYENTNDKTGSFSLTDLRLKDTEDHSFSQYYLGGKKPEMGSGDLEPGGTVRGYMTFEIPEESTPQSVVYGGGFATIIFLK